MSKCMHNIVLYFGREKEFNKYSINYTSKYICAGCGSTDIFNGSRVKMSIDLSRDNIDDINKMYEEYLKIKDNIDEVLEDENQKNNVKTLVLKT